MDYQNKPVEWFTNEDTEKVAKKDESGRSTTNNTINTLGQLALVGSGAEIARRGINTDHTSPSKTREFIKKQLKPIGKKAIMAGGATAALGHSGVKAMDFAATELIGKHAPEKVEDLAQIAKVRSGASKMRTAGAATAIGGAGALLGHKYMKTRVLDKKRLAGKLGLITGGAALTGAGLYGLVSEKRAAQQDDHTMRNAALTAGGVGAIAGARKINTTPTIKYKKAIKRTIQAASAGVGGLGLAGIGSSVHLNRTADKQNLIGYVVNKQVAGTLGAAGSVATLAGTTGLVGAAHINTNPLNKKRLAAKLGLITGGAAAAAAGAYGLVNKEASTKEDKKKSSNNLALGLGGALGAATGLALDTAPLNQNKARVAARAGLLASSVPLMSGSLIAADTVERNANRMRKAGTFYKNRKAYNVARGMTAAGFAAGMLAPVAAMTIPNKHNKKLLAAKLGLVTGGTAAMGAALYNATKDKTASRKEEKHPSGWNRFARGVLGHIALPTIGAAATGAGAVLADAADHVSNPFGKAALLGSGALLAAGGLGTMIGGPIANDAYQAYRYIEEH